MPMSKKSLAALALLSLAVLTTSIPEPAQAASRPTVADGKHLSFRNGNPEQIYYTFTKKKDRFRKPDANSQQLTSTAGSSRCPGASGFPQQSRRLPSVKWIAKLTQVAIRTITTIIPAYQSIIHGILMCRKINIISTTRSTEAAPSK
jgi:hypothetical protein